MRGHRLTVHFPTDYPLLVVLPSLLLGISPHVTLLSRSFLLLHSSSGRFNACDPGAHIGSSALRPAISFIWHCSGCPLARTSLHGPCLCQPWPHRRPSHQDPFGIADALVFQMVRGVDSGACSLLRMSPPCGLRLATTIRQRSTSHRVAVCQSSRLCGIGSLWKMV